MSTKFRESESLAVVADDWSDVDPDVLLALRVLESKPAAIRHRAAAHLSRDAQADAPDHDAATLPRKPR